jgi:hypothetical protein
VIGLISILLFIQLDHFGFDTIPSPQTAGDSISITVTAYDAGGIPYPYSGMSRIYTSWDNPMYPQYCDTLIHFSNGTWSGDVPVSLAADTLSLKCDDGGGHLGVSNIFQVLPNTAARLLSILPNQNYSPGTATGRTGNPMPQPAGEQFYITLYLTDYWYNQVNVGNDSVRITSTDQFIFPKTMALSSGNLILPFSFRTATNQKIYFQDITNLSIDADTSSTINIYAADYSDLLVILPGETLLPGDTTTSMSNTPGKSGVPAEHYELEDFLAIVYATDSMWNKTNTTGPAVQLYSDFVFSNPLPETLSNGQVNFTINFSDTGRVVLWAQNNTIRSNNNYLNILPVIDTSAVTDSFIAFPNPMGIDGNRMNFVYRLPYSCKLIFAIYDPFGNLIYREDLDPGVANKTQFGINRIVWDGRNQKRERVASGVYYAVLKAWSHTATIFNKKMKVGVVW